MAAGRPTSSSSGHRFLSRADVRVSVPRVARTDEDRAAAAFKLMHALFMRRMAAEVNKWEEERTRR